MYTSAQRADEIYIEFDAADLSELAAEHLEDLG